MTKAELSVRVLIAALALMVFPAIGVAESAKTSKERLSDKAADDQRVDDCRVPLERRGPTARPDCSGKVPPAATREEAIPPRSR